MMIQCMRLNYLVDIGPGAGEHGERLHAYAKGNEKIKNH